MCVSCITGRLFITELPGKPWVNTFEQLRSRLAKADSPQLRLADTTGQKSAFLTAAMQEEEAWFEDRVRLAY